MTVLFLESFDKYGAANTNSTIVQGLLTAGEWTTAAGTLNIVGGLSATGFALSVTTGPVSKTLPATLSRIIGGVRFSTNLATSGWVLQFRDSVSQQACVVVNNTGTVSVRNGNSAGTLLGTSTASITANTTHYLEWDITFSNTGPYQIWMDGVSILSGSGDTTATANNSITSFEFAPGAGNTTIFDDLYVFDSSGNAPLNAVLLTSPRIETQFPTSDGVVQFAIGAAILGSSVTRSSSFSSNAANQWRARPFTPTRNCTLNAVAFLPNTTSAALNFRPMIYSDSAGLPGTLLSTGATVTGMTANTAVVMPLATPQALIAGTQYWLGYMCDAVSGGASLYQLDGSTAGERIGVSTFASGAPSTAPGTLTATATTLIWGSITGTGVNWYEVSQNPAQGSNSYVYDATVNHEDLYTFPALSVTPSAIYGVAVKTIVSKTDAGAKTMSVRCKSGATDSAGTSGTIAPGTSYAWVSSLFPTDPNTSAAWTLSALNAAQGGVKVET